MPGNGIPVISVNTIGQNNCCNQQDGGKVSTVGAVWREDARATFDMKEPNECHHTARVIVEPAVRRRGDNDRATLSRCRQRIATAVLTFKVEMPLMAASATRKPVHNARMTYHVAGDHLVSPRVLYAWYSGWVSLVSCSGIGHG